jgi:hypothetical protein
MRRTLYQDLHSPWRNRFSFFVWYRERCKPLLIARVRAKMHAQASATPEYPVAWMVPSLPCWRNHHQSSTVLCTRWSRARALRDNSGDCHLSQALRSLWTAQPAHSVKNPPLPAHFRPSLTARSFTGAPCWGTIWVGGPQPPVAKPPPPWNGRWPGKVLGSFGDTVSHLPDCCSLYALVSDAEGP